MEVVELEGLVSEAYRDRERLRKANLIERELQQRSTEKTSATN